MSHQPFENWILDPVDLTMEERRSLQAHIDSCATCRKLEQKWQAVRQELRPHNMVAPASGFVQRWQASLVKRRAQEQRKQAWRVFGLLLGGAALFLLLLSGYLLLNTSPAQWLVSVIGMVSSSKVLLQMVMYVVQNWLTRTPLALNIALWIYLTLTLCVLALVWVGVLWRTNSVGVQNQ